MISLGRPFADSSVANTAVQALIKRVPAPSPDDLTSFFKGLPKKNWTAAATALITAGVPGDVIRSSMYAAVQTEIAWVKGGLTMLSASFSAYHGGRRNDSIFWGAWWFIAGMTFPVFAPLAALIQGYAKKKGS